MYLFVNFRVCETPIWLDLCKPGKHMFTRNSDVVDYHEPGVVSQVTDFGTEVPKLNTRKWFVVFITNLKHKYMKTSFFSIYN